jgi:CelD/BcsL family acetyltransferase involved in cellulose biosynthesis
MSAITTGVTGRGAAERERVRFEGPDALERMADLGWDELVLGQPAPDVTRTAGWLAAATDDRERSALRALGVVRDGRLAAGILLARGRRLGLSILGEFGRAGTWYDLTPPAEDEEARAGLLAPLAGERADLLVLSGVERESSFEHSLLTAFPGALREQSSFAYRLTLAAPPKRIRERRRAARAAHRRAADGGEPLTVDWVTRWPDVEAELEGVLDLHRANFRDESANGLSAPASRGRTLAVLADAGRAGRVRLMLARRGGRLLAFNVTLVEGGHALAFATGFDRKEDVPQLGWAASIATLEALQGEGVETVDLGPGPAESYKYRLSDRVDRGRVIVPRSRLGRMAVAARRLRAGSRG